MLYNYSDYRTYLRATLSERAAISPRFSMRYFAKKLGVSPAMLSLVTNGKRNFDPVQALKIAKRLGLDPREAQYFHLLVQLATAKSADAQNVILERLNDLNPSRQFQDLSLDAFAVISEWYHFPILQLLKIEDFNFDPPNISKRLGISLAEAASALTRLERLGVIKVENGKYTRVREDFRVESKDRNDALRSFHRQMLQRAMASLQDQSNDEKYVGSETLAFDPAQLPQAKKMIDEFFDQMNTFFDRGSRPAEVYHFGIQFFRLTVKS